MTPRALAVRALLRQEQDGYADLVLDAELRRCRPPLDARDAAFATAVFYAVIERLPLLDYTLQRHCSRPLARLDAPVRAILRAGLAQGRYMDVPVRAAVDESVKLTRQFGKGSAAGFVNAVLRRALAAPPPTGQELVDPKERLAVYGGLSAPVAGLLWEQYGEQAFEMAQAFGEKRPAAIRVNTLRAAPDSLGERLQAEGHTVHGPGPLPGSLLVTFAGSPARSACFCEGLFHVQGLASQYAALCVGARPGERVLDLCAAPGGKSLLLAQQMQDQGLLLANDAAPARVRLLQEALRRAGVHCAQAVCNDAAADPVFTQGQPPFDRILCDVPCTGLGVIGKKPDIRYKALQDLPALYALQKSILQNAAKTLAPNGRLVYSTCTVNFYENQARIRAFLQQNPDFCLVRPEIGFPGAQCTDDGVLFLPHRTATDGFFVAVLEKRPPGSR